MKRIGVLGGSFNPPHDGHLYIAQYAYEELGLDEVWLLVTPRNPHKDPDKYAPFGHRLQMCRLMAEGNPWLRTTSIEQHFPTTSTTDTLTILSAMRPDSRFIWIMGADNLASFHKWKRVRHKVDGEPAEDWRYMMHNVPLAVLARPGDPSYAAPSPASEYGAQFKVSDPRALGLKTNGLCFLPNPPMDVSSTQILRDIAAHKDVVPGLRPVVRDYARLHGLYGLNTAFDAAAQMRVVTEPKAPLEIYIVLATAVNYLKAVGAASPHDMLSYFEACHKKSVRKGDFGKSADIAGEIADCTISMYWLMSALQQQAVGRTDGCETQASVTQWCDTHYPDRTIRHRSLDFIEELAELSACSGMALEDALPIMQTIFDETPDQPVKILKYDACVFSALNETALSLGTTLQEALDNKMAINRGRSIAESAARCDIKKESLPGPD